MTKLFPGVSRLQSIWRSFCKEVIRWVWDDFEVSLNLDQELILILEEPARLAMLHEILDGEGSLSLKINRLEK